MRGIDIKRVQSNNIKRNPTQISENKKVLELPRNFAMTISQNKSNIQGNLEAGRENLTYVIACTCYHIYAVDNNDRGIRYYDYFIFLNFYLISWCSKLSQVSQS